MRWLEQQPELIANSIKFAQMDEDELLEIRKNPELSPNSLDVANSDPLILAFTTDKIVNGGSNISLQVDFENHSLDYKLRDNEERDKDFDEFKKQHGKITIPDATGTGINVTKTLSDKEVEQLYEKSDYKGKYKDENLNLAEYVARSVDTKAPSSFAKNGNMQESVEAVTGKTTKQLMDNLTKLYPTSSENKKLTPAVRGENMDKFNKGFADGLVKVDNSALMNDGALAESLWSGSVDRSVTRVTNLANEIESGDRDINDLNAIEEELLEVWYGENWDESELELEEDDMINKYFKEGIGAMGAWKFLEGEEGKNQGDIMSNDINNINYNQNAMVEAPNYKMPPKTTTRTRSQAKKHEDRLTSFGKSFYDNSGTLKQGHTVDEVIKIANSFVKDDNIEYLTKADIMTRSDLSGYYPIGNKGQAEADKVINYVDDLPDDAVIRLNTGEADWKPNKIYVVADQNTFGTHSADFSKTFKY